jgi:hypothetical protein
MLEGHGGRVTANSKFRQILLATLGERHLSPALALALHGVFRDDYRLD